MSYIRTIQTNDTMGDTNEKEAEIFCEFLARGLQAQFPDADVVVTLNCRLSSDVTTVSDDLDANDVKAAINRLWDQWPGAR